MIRLLRTFLVGVGRSPVPAVPELEPALSAASIRAVGGEEAAQLLDALALDATRRHVGFEPDRPEAFETLPEPPPETRAEAPPLAARLLSSLLAPGASQSLLREWLERCHRSGFRVPATALPALLELATVDAALRASVRAVTGTRGDWLARLEPRWAFAATAEVGAQPESVMRTRLRQSGSLRELRATFEGLRSIDLSSAVAVALEAWPAWSAREKVAVLDAIALPQPPDELLLERARRDSAKSVRAAATDRLTRLEGSALLERMEARVASSLRIEQGVLRMLLPDRLDPEAEADGVLPSAPEGPRGWVEQMIGMVPPSRLSAFLEAPPVALLAAADRGPHGPGLRLAFTAATLRHADPIWAEALLAWRVPGEAALLLLLPQSRRDAWLLARLHQATTPERLHTALGHLPNLSRPISLRLARAALLRLDELERKGGGRPFPAFGALRRLALDAELEDDAGPSLLGALGAFARGRLEHSPWREAAEEAVRAVRARHALARAFEIET